MRMQIDKARQQVVTMEVQYAVTFPHRDTSGFRYGLNNAQTANGSNAISFDQHVHRAIGWSTLAIDDHNAAQDQPVEGAVPPHPFGEFSGSRRQRG